MLPPSLAKPGLREILKTGAERQSTANDRMGWQFRLAQPLPQTIPLFLAVERNKVRIAKVQKSRHTSSDFALYFCVLFFDPFANCLQRRHRLIHT
ncbi:hypothetical protein [Bradyrhizobium sp. Cp5.3]|uniref:hypothetical protein n=1 Tax=Bradyrhizobium sp. Cp5.3 TaxID=443598 RepID=UPI001FD8CC43|nr:hypothetical protein [Bradyrhizobium sp. Cp5.3]